MELDDTGVRRPGHGRGVRLRVFHGGHEGHIAELARRVQGGEAMTLLCSSACVDPERCHRTMLARLITEAAEKPKAQPRRKR
ncbi:hypothetical protein BE11_42630 [Sorangium cellulosum]|nr:hypothetical protein BE11_42630 [Sorangium cellulosum]